MKAEAQQQHVVVAISGASGACYALTLLRHLLASGCRVSLLTSTAGRQVLRLELEDIPLAWPDDPAHMQAELKGYFAADPGQLRCYAEDDFMAPVASGSAGGDAMVIVPASMGMVGRLAAGVSSSLIERAADVTLKERRPLIVVPRETPFHTIHLRNLLTLSEAGAIVLPAMPAFYARPRSLQDIADFIAARILDQLGIEHHLVPRWGEDGAVEGE
ncbi:MAG: UbiX family flavin prenyltransferase [Desulfuromonadaceae bacterium]